MSFTIKIGQRFGKLVVVGPAITGVGGHVSVQCQCDCGKRVVKRQAYLTYYPNRQHSCGCSTHARCRHGYAHGDKPTPVYKKWISMKSRCLPTWSQKEDYYERGITVCDRWLKFENFLEDMGEPPLGYELDRIDNNGNYEPGNCRWVPRLVNQRNRRVSMNLTFGGITLPLIEWANELGISYQTLLYRAKSKWSPKDILRKEQI